MLTVNLFNVPSSGFSLIDKIVDDIVGSLNKLKLGENYIIRLNSGMLNNI